MTLAPIARLNRRDVRSLPRMGLLDDVGLGLDVADPCVAIAAMQAMNASMRNLVLAPSFFGTSPVLPVAVLLCRRRVVRAAALRFAAPIYLIAGNVPPFALSVPINEALATIAVPQDASDTADLWTGYSLPRQTSNLARAVACGAAPVMAGPVVAASTRADATDPPGAARRRRSQPAAIRLCLPAIHSFAVSTATAASRQ